jgi:sucrose-6-phosphate hydrolase SacC (GH32 family)
MLTQPNRVARSLAFAVVATVGLLLGAGKLRGASPGRPQTEPSGRLRDKTLVVWAAPANLTQHGGSALTIDDQKGHFDGIVFGELSPAKWMAGSDFYRRTERKQAAWPAETASATDLVQIAIVYHGNEITTCRDGKEYSRHYLNEPQGFGKDSAVLIGLRHLEAGDRACFAGTIADARIYNVALTADQIAALKAGEASDPKPMGWWNFKTGKPDDLMGTFPAGNLVGNAHIADGKLVLDGNGSYMVTVAPPRPPAPLLAFDSPIHYRPAADALADTIPFFWKGEYHVFYLRVAPNTPWEHIVSTDLVHWRELPTALVSSGPPDGPDGANMFTGSVTERDGTFHIFYTGHNGNNPRGIEFICHATSPDLITWTKHPQDALAPDGTLYDDRPKRDFRDPYVFWNDVERRWWLVFFGNDAKTHHGVQGLAVSDDLNKWEFQPPLEGACGQECPDLFRLGDHWCLIGGDHYSIADSPRGPYRKPPVSDLIDRPNIYAAKRMFDGKRHVWTGWVWDIPSHRDGERNAWGGTQCLPRELYAGPNGQVYSKPVDEITAAFKKTVLERESLDVGASSSFDVPEHYMLQCQVRLDPKAEWVVYMRQQAEDGKAYRFTLNPEKNEIQLSGPGFNYKRPCPVDVARPIQFEAFVQGTIIECFVNDQYAQSCRAYDSQKGKLTFEARGGAATVLNLAVKVDDDPRHARVP